MAEAQKVILHMGPATRSTNTVLRWVGFSDRGQLTEQIRGITGILPDQHRLIDILQRQKVLKPGFSGDLSCVQPKDFRRFSTDARLEAASWEISRQAEAMQMPDGLAGLPNLSRIIIGLKLKRQAESMKEYHRQGQDLIQKVSREKRITPEILAQAQKTVAEVKASLGEITQADARAVLERLTTTIETNLGKQQPSAEDLREVCMALGEINDIASQITLPNEPESAHTGLKFGSALSRLLCLGFMGSLIVLGTQEGYRDIDRAFYWTVLTSLGLYSCMASNFMKIMSESESLPNLEFTQNNIAYRDLPREITKRFSNSGLPGGIGALLQDFYLNLCFGNHDVVLNNDPNNSFYQSTLGDAREIWRIEKRAALIEIELRSAVTGLSDAKYRKMAGVMAMGERDIPGLYSLLEATQESGIHLGKVTRLLFKVRDKIAELGGELGRDDLVCAARDSGIDQARAEHWADCYLGRVQSTARMDIIAKSTKKLLYHCASNAEKAELTRMISIEFGLDPSRSEAIVSTIEKNTALEHDARALNNDHDVPIQTRARLRDLVHLILFHERTGDERVHEEGNFAAIALTAEENSYLRRLLGGLPDDFLTKGRKGSMAEKIFLSFVARGVEKEAAQVLTDNILADAAKAYNERFSAESFEIKCAEMAERPWWEVDSLLFENFLSFVETTARTASTNADLSPEMANQVVGIVRDELTLHQGILNRTVDGYLSLTCQDAKGIAYVAGAIAGSIEANGLQTRLRNQKEETDKRKKQVAKLLFGDDREALKKAEPVFKAVDSLMQKGIGFLRAEKRFQDGHLLSFTSLAVQIPDILFGKDPMHRTMLDKTNRYQAGTFQEYEFTGVSVPDAVKALFEGKKTEETREAIAQLVEALQGRYEIREDVQDLLRKTSREIGTRDYRVLRIREIKTELKKTPNTEQEERSLRELHALESQIHQTRERVSESAMNPFTDIVVEEMEKTNTPLTAGDITGRSADIVMKTVEKESQKYGLASNPANKPILDALRAVVESLIESANPMRKTAAVPENVLWSSCLFFERMNYEKWKGSKGSNNDSGSGFYLGERIGVKLYSLLEYLTKDRVMLPADILAAVHREFCDKIRLSGNHTEDQRQKEQKGMLPEQIVVALVDSINNGEMSCDAVDELAQGWDLAGEHVGHLAALYEIASEIAVRVHGHKVLGFVAAKNESGPIDEASLPERAKGYLASARANDNVDKLMGSWNLTDNERNTLRKEANLLRARLDKNEEIKKKNENWFKRRKAALVSASDDRRVRALEEERDMRMDRRTLFHPDMPWYLIPAIDQPFSRGDRWLQFFGKKLQERRREFILPCGMAAEETAARMMTMANNRIPMRKIENGFVRDYGKAFLDQARAIDGEIAKNHPDGILGMDIDKVAEEMTTVAPFLDTARFERPIECERDAVRDVDTDNFLFESSQHKASAYWEKRNGKILRSYSAALQTQQYYPEMGSRLSTSQNLMGILYSTVLGKAYGKRGKQVIMGCYIVKNRKALAEAVDWIEIPYLKRQEEELFDAYMGNNFKNNDEKNAALAMYRKHKLVSECVLAAGLIAIATGLASGAAIPLLAGVAGGLFVRRLNLAMLGSNNADVRGFGEVLIPASIITTALFNPIAGIGAYFGTYHYDDLVKYLPYHFGIDTRTWVADRFGISRTSATGKWLLKRQKMVRMYEEEEVYSQPDDVEDFGSSIAIFQRGYHCDFHQSIDGVSDDVKDKGTLDGQRGRWHGGMEDNFRRAVSAFLWDRQAMPSLDWMRYTLQTLGPAGSFSRLALNVNLWMFIGTGASALVFGADPDKIIKLLCICSGLSIANYGAFMLTMRSAMNTYGSTWDKTSDMFAVLDSLSPINVDQGVARVRYGITPPFLTTKTPHVSVSTNIGTWQSKMWPFWPVLSKPDPRESKRKIRGTKIELINSVVQANRIRFAYVVGTAGILSLSIPGVSTLDLETAGKAGILGLISLWTYLPVYYANRGLDIASEGSAPFGTLRSIRDSKKVK